MLKFADKEDQKTIHVHIKKDNKPELAETVTVELLSVKLVSGSPKNYSSVDGLPLNTAPRISPAKNKVMIVIAENDDARGKYASHRVLNWCGKKVELRYWKSLEKVNYDRGLFSCLNLN